MNTKESVRQITLGYPRLTGWKALMGKYSDLHFDATTERTDECIQTMVLIFSVRAKRLMRALLDTSIMATGMDRLSCNLIG